MKAIRYSIHFPSLIVAALVYWLAQDLDLPASIINFRIIHYGLMGALHATSIVVSLRDRKAFRPITALYFITLAVAWSVATPIMALWSSILWVPVLEILPRSHFTSIVLILDGSAIGSAGYWVLVRWFWMKSLRRADLLRTATLCVAATLLVTGISEVIPASGPLMRPKFWDNVFELLLTAAWYFAFSISLYWSEMSKYARKPTEVIA